MTADQIVTDIMESCKRELGYSLDNAEGGDALDTVLDKTVERIANLSGRDCLELLRDLLATEVLRKCGKLKGEDDGN